tara:strand:+ start:5495 stop:5962 length:468 start_codon:yes stop_codon:yes gene_type:complete
MLDILLYRLVIKDYIPSLYELFPDFYQESLFSIPEEENINVDNYTTIDTINPVKRIADSKYGRIITLFIMLLITAYSVHISNKCNGPGKSMYISFSLLFPITHFIILKLPSMISEKLGNMIGCDFEQIKKKQQNIEKIKSAAAAVQGGKYKKKYK